MSKIYRARAKVSVDVGNILHLEEQSEMTVESVKNVIEETRKIKALSNPTRGLIDVRGVNLTKAVSLRPYLQELIKVTNLEKAAIFTDNRLLWIFTTFMYNAIGRKNPNNIVRFFLSEDEAVKWLKV